MGTYSEIVEIVAPESAVAGSMVNVEVKIKNTWSSQVHIYCVAVLDSETLFIDWPDAWIGAGETRSFYGSFIMPNRRVTINAYSYFEATDGYLYSDGSRQKTVELTALAPQVSEFQIADYIKV